MRKALRSPTFEPMPSSSNGVAGDDSGQAFLDYALIAGVVAAIGVTVLTLITHGTLGAFLNRIAGSFAG